MESHVTPQSGQFDGPLKVSKIVLMIISLLPNPASLMPLKFPNKVTPDGNVGMCWVTAHSLVINALEVPIAWGGQIVEHFKTTMKTNRKMVILKASIKLLLSVVEISGKLDTRVIGKVGIGCTFTSKIKHFRNGHELLLHFSRGRRR